MIKKTISLTPELYSALTRAALDSNMSISRVIETHLRESKYLNRYIQEVRAEPDMGVLLANPKTLREKSRSSELAASASE